MGIGFLTIPFSDVIYLSPEPTSSLFYYYYRSRLEHAFYRRTTSPLRYWYHHLLAFFSGNPEAWEGVRLCTLGQSPYVEQLPHYIATAAANGWKRRSNTRDPYHVITLESGGAMRMWGIDDYNDDLVVDVGKETIVHLSSIHLLSRNIYVSMETRC